VTDAFAAAGFGAATAIGAGAKDFCILL